ncbi:MAG TPA: alkaline phosphatase family protein [Solirubrobacteraceae bacterium]
MRRRLGLAAALLAAISLPALMAPALAAAAPPIRHVFVIVLENENQATSFGPNSPAPYLAQTLKSEGAYVPNYYGVGHNSNDNYIAMISGQAPNASTQADCQTFSEMTPGTLGANGQAVGTGCVYPAAVGTIASQLSAAGFTWRDYNESMGADLSREPAVCAHPAIGASDNTQSATATDEYATRHNPFVYFHGIIDDTTLCDTHVVGLNALSQDLSSPSSIANYSFITPDLCNDGHDAPCKNGQPGGLTSANQFLQTWVPQITASQAFREDGLLMVIFDEASTSDTSSCCGAIAGPGSPTPGITGPGGGQTGAVLLSPCIAPGTVTNVAYNHYSMLSSVEDAFGLAHLGYAGLPGEATFGSDIYNRPCGAAPPTASATAPPLLSRIGTRARIPLTWSSTTTGGTGLASYAVTVSDLSAAHRGSRTLLTGTQRTALTFTGQLGHTYSFSVTATNLAGQTSPVASSTVVVPSGIRPAKGHYSAGWHVRRVKAAWQGKSIASSVKGATFTLRYRGGALAVIGERTAGGGVARVTLDRRTRTIRLHASRRLTRQVVYRALAASAAAATHRLTITVVRGTVALEGFAISARRS